MHRVSGVLWREGVCCGPVEVTWLGIGKSRLLIVASFVASYYFLSIGALNKLPYRVPS